MTSNQLMKSVLAEHRFYLGKSQSLIEKKLIKREQRKTRFHFAEREVLSRRQKVPHCMLKKKWNAMMFCIVEQKAQLSSIAIFIK